MRIGLFILALFIGTQAMAARLPIVYDDNYNFHLKGLETRHPFTNKKYSITFNYLKNQGWLKPRTWHIPRNLSKHDLSLVHTEEYLTALEDPDTVFSGFEWTAPLKPTETAEIAHGILQTELRGAAGTVLAAKLALEEPYGWAINLSGGYHHAYAENGAGFCLIADGPIAILKVLEAHPDYKILIVDLDAHHGDGNAAIFEGHPQVFIFDIYNHDNFPFPTLDETRAKREIAYDFPIPYGTQDEEYLYILKTELPKAIREVKPQLIFYNAGTDIYENDSLGGLKISADGIIQRDEFVFTVAKEENIPIFMAMSGGYAPDVFEIIGRSIENLLKKIVPTRL